MTNLTESLAHLPATLQQFEERTGLAEQWGQTLSDKGSLVDVYVKKEKP